MNKPHYSIGTESNHTYMKHLKIALYENGTNPIHSQFRGYELDRVPKKSKFAEWPAEFIAYSRDKSKDFLLTKFFKILQNARAHQQFRQ